MLEVRPHGDGQPLRAVPAIGRQRHDGRGVAGGHAALVVGIFQSPRPHREGAREGVGQLLTGRGGELQAHVGSERNPDRVHQHLGHALLGDLHRGRALAEFLVKGLAAEQLQGEVHLALVIGEVVHPAERAQ